MLLRLGFGLISNPPADSQEPSPIFTWTEIAKRKPQVKQVEAKRYIPASRRLPFHVIFDDVAGYPFGRRANQQAGVSSRNESQKFPVGILQLLSCSFSEMGGCSVIVKQIGPRPKGCLPTH